MERATVSSRRESSRNRWRASGAALAAVLAGASIARATQDPVAIRAPRPVLRHATARYDLRVQGSEDEAAKYGAMLEQAWPVFREFFKGEPRLADGERLAVKMYDSRQECLEAAMGDEADMPPIKHPAWFSPKSGAVYLYRDASEYFTRALVIYGACMQFHGSSKAKNRDLDEWYTHGIAESFAVHAWDGQRLELATRPRVYMVDHPGRALAALGGRHLGLDPFTDERVEDASVRWAVVRYALAGSGGRHRARFEKLALGHSGSRMSGHDFMRSLGREEKIAEEFSAWLLAEQVPLEAVRGDWEGYSDGRIEARPKADEFALCPAKANFDVVEAEIAGCLSLRSSGGLLVAYLDTRNFVIVRPSPPMLFFDHYQAGKPAGTEPFPLERKVDVYTLRARRIGGRVQVDVDGKSYPPIELHEGRLGLAATGGPVTFRNVKCRDDEAAQVAPR